MSTNRDAKKVIMDKVTNEIKANEEINAFVVNYTALTSPQMTELKKLTLQASGKLTIVKNTLMMRIFSSLGVELPNKLEGQNALMLTGKDAVAPLKEFFAFAKKAEKGSILFGVLAGNFINKERVEQLSKLPSRDELLGRVLGGFSSPIQGFVYTLTGVQSNFVRALNAVREKKASD